VHREKPKKEDEDQELAQIILEYHEKFGHILGYRRMKLFIRRLSGLDFNVKKIRRMMRLLGVSSAIRRKRKGYVKSTPQITAENVLNREFKAQAANEKWVTDVTEFKVIGTRKKIYLSGILDLYDRRIVAYVIAMSNNNKLVFETFDLAMAVNPGAKPLLHSDRGFQYTSKAFRRKLDVSGTRQSMSRVSKCIDNGPMEGFWGTLKSEMYYLNRFHSVEDLKQAIRNYIEFYNYRRFQPVLKGLTPFEFGHQAFQV
jgi:putative transposase